MRVNAYKFSFISDKALKFKAYEFRFVKKEAIPSFSIYARSYQRLHCFLIKMRDISFNIDYLSPTGLIGFWVLFIGLIFTGFMFYFVFFRLNENDTSYKDIKRKKLEIEAQKQKIAKLYPKGKYY